MKSMTPIILVTVDGSDKDERAIAVAAALAELGNATIRVVRVFEPLVETLPSSASELAAVALRADVVKNVRQTAERMHAMLHREVMPDVIDGFDVAATLLDDLKVHDASLVVMATRAAGAVGRAIHGSVADLLVRESPRPVVLVPPRAEYLGGKHITLRRVLVPVDGSLAALRVIPTLLALSRAEALELVLLQVVRRERVGSYVMPQGTPTLGDQVPDGGEWTHVGAAVAERRLGAIAGDLRARGGQAEVRVIESADVSSVIVDAIRNDLVELVAMSTRGESGLRRLMLGSVAEQVVRHSEVPVLLVTARSGPAVPLSLQRV
jgi:nucleotide-binding universal stress UspA family protein